MTAKFATCLAVVGLLMFAGCRRTPDTLQSTPLPAAVVRTAVLAARPLMTSELVVGTVRSKTRAVIESRVGGKIDVLAVNAGQLVKRGDLLAQLDVREIQARLDQARASLEQADRDLERYTALIKQNVLTKAEYDTAEARQRIAKAAVTEAETMLGYARVVAPFDGVVTRKLAEVGDLAAPGRGIVELEDPGSLRIECEVPEGLIDRIKLGAGMTVSAADSTQTMSGIVSEIAPAANPASRTFLVKLDLPAGAGLRLGQFARVVVPTGEKPTLRLPAGAVVVRGQMEIVFVVQKQVAHLRLVKTGRKSDGQVEIASGLEAGETVVVAGAADLMDGQPIQEQP
jgi:RND family efflux transporter MFP subunit